MRLRPQTWTRTVMLPAEGANPWNSLIGTQESGLKLESIQEKRQLNRDPFLCHINCWSRLQTRARGRFGYWFKRHCWYYKLLLGPRQKHARCSPSLLPHFIWSKIETACRWKQMYCFLFYKHLKHKCEWDKMNVKCAFVLRFVGPDVRLHEIMCSYINMCL